MFALFYKNFHSTLKEIRSCILAKSTLSNYCFSKYATYAYLIISNCWLTVNTLDCCRKYSHTLCNSSYKCICKQAGSLYWYPTTSSILDNNNNLKTYTPTRHDMISCEGQIYFLSVFWSRLACRPIIFRACGYIPCRPCWSTIQLGEYY